MERLELPAARRPARRPASRAVRGGSACPPGSPGCSTTGRSPGRSGTARPGWPSPGRSGGCRGWRSSRPGRSAGRWSSRPGGGVGQARGRGADDLEEGGLDLVARAVRVPPEQDVGLGGLGAGLGDDQGPVGRRPWPSSARPAPCGARDTAGPSPRRGSRPRRGGSARARSAGGERLRPSGAARPALRGRERPVLEPGAGPGDGQARAPCPPGSSRAGSAPGPCFSSTLPDCSVALAVDPVVLDDLPAGDGQPGAVVGVEEEGVRPSLGTISVPSKTKPNESSRDRGARSNRPSGSLPASSGLRASKSGSSSQVSR